MLITLNPNHQVTQLVKQRTGCTAACHAVRRKISVVVLLRISSSKESNVRSKKPKTTTTKDSTRSHRRGEVRGTPSPVLCVNLEENGLGCTPHFRAITRLLSNPLSFFLFWHLVVALRVEVGSCSNDSVNWHILNCYIQFSSRFEGRFLSVHRSTKARSNSYFVRSSQS